MKWFTVHWKTLSAGLVVLVAAGAGVLLSAGSGESMAEAKRSAGADDPSPRAAAERSSRVETVLVERRDLTRTVEMPGTVEGFETADLYAKVGGYLEEIKVDIGDLIRKDDELARLSIPEMEQRLLQKVAVVEQAEAEVAQAIAAIAQAHAEVLTAEALVLEAEAEEIEKQGQLRFRKKDHQRYLGLVDKEVVTPELLDQAEDQLAAAEAAVLAAQARRKSAEAKEKAAGALVAKATADRTVAEKRVAAAQADHDFVEAMNEYAVIRAPFDGVVTRRFVDRGHFVQPAEGNSGAKPLVTVARTDVVRVFLDLPMRDVRLLDRANAATGQRGDRAVLTRIYGMPDREFEGEITRFSPTLDKASRMMRVEVDLPNPDNELLPGYYGYLTVYLEEMPDTPVIPSSALLTNGKEQYVFLCENGHAKKCTVTTNFQDGSWVGIASGLDGGENVVRSGGGQITDGQPVTSVLAQK